MKYRLIITCLLLVMIFFGCQKDKTSDNIIKDEKLDINEKEFSIDIIDHEDDLVDKPTISDEFKLDEKPKFTKTELTFNKIDTEGNIIDKSASLIGFDSNNYYILYDNEQNWIYATGNEKDNIITPFYEVSKEYDIFFDDIYEGNLLIGLGYWEDTICHYELFWVAPDKNKKSIFQCETRGYPTVCLIDNYVVINLSEKIDDNQYNSKLLYIDLKTDENEIVETHYYKNVNNLYDGTFIINAGGWKEGFCYEKVEMSNEAIEEAESGKSTFHYYSFKNKKSIQLTTYSRKVFYINGMEDCFVTSDYLLIPYENTGRLWIKEDGEYRSYIIPNISPGMDIRDSFQLSDNIILIYNYKYYYIYDIKNKTYYKEQYEFYTSDPDSENYISLSIKSYKNKFAYREPNQEKLIYHVYELQN